MVGKSHLENLALWEVFSDKSTDEQRAMVRKLVNDAEALLGRLAGAVPQEV